MRGTCGEHSENIQGTFSKVHLHEVDGFLHALLALHHLFELGGEGILTGILKTANQVAAQRIYFGIRPIRCGYQSLLQEMKLL
jgi:hypothetical protein